MKAAEYRKAIAGGVAAAFAAATWAAATWLPVLHGTAQTAAQVILAVAAVPAVAAWVARAPRNVYAHPYPAALPGRGEAMGPSNVTVTDPTRNVYRTRPDVPTTYDPPQ